MHAIRYYQLRAHIYSHTEGKTEDYYENMETAISIAKQLGENDLLGELYYAHATGQSDIGWDELKNL